MSFPPNHLPLPLLITVLLSLGTEFGCVGCVGTPMPDPPAVQREALSGYLRDGQSIVMEGATGAVTVPGSTVTVWNLSSLTTPEQVLVASDGSFALRLQGNLYHSYRVQAEHRGLRSVPVDVGWVIAVPTISPTCTFFREWELCPNRPDRTSCEDFSSTCQWSVDRCLGSAPSPLPACADQFDEAACHAFGCVWDYVSGPVDSIDPAGPLARCLDVTPSTDLDIANGGRSTVRVHNGCNTSVTLGFSLWDGARGFAMENDPGSVELIPAATAELSISFDSGDATETVTDILFIDIVAPQSGQWPITLHGNL